MTYRLTITAPAFQHILQQTTTTSQRPFIYPAGLSRVQDSLEFLLHTTPGSLRSLNHSSVSVVGFNILSNDVLRTLVREESLPLHASTCTVLADYIARRQRHWAGRAVS